MVDIRYYTSEMCSPYITVQVPVFPRQKSVLNIQITEK